MSIFSAYSSAYGHNIDHVEVEWVTGKRMGQTSKIWWIGQLAGWADSIVDKQKDENEKEVTLKLELTLINQRRNSILKELKELKDKKATSRSVTCLRCSTIFISEKDRFGRTIKRICPECTSYNDEIFSGSIF